MSNALGSAKLSDIIQTATQKMVENTESFLESVKNEPVGDDAISMMLNGKETVLSKENYGLLKAQNEATKKQMKEDIKAMTAQYKAHLK
ncbi:MAG: hypothetical protein ACK5L0_05245 [Candidatus Fimivivens sp.]